MKGRTLSILGIFATVAGLILILCKDSISVTGVTITGGILFVGVGLINLIFFSTTSKSENAISRVLTLISNAAAIVLGLSMLVFRSTFDPLISFIFGLLVAVCALWQFFVLAIGSRPYQLPAWLYIFPVLLVAGSVYIYLNNGDKSAGERDSILMLTTGISFLVLGVACLIEGSALGIARRNFEHARQQSMTQSDVTQEQEKASDTERQPVDVTATEVQHTTATVVPARHSETTDDLDDEIKPQTDYHVTTRRVQTTDDLDDEVE